MQKQTNKQANKQKTVPTYLHSTYILQTTGIHSGRFLNQSRSLLSRFEPLRQAVGSYLTYWNSPFRTTLEIKPKWPWKSGGFGWGVHSYTRKYTVINHEVWPERLKSKTVLREEVSCSGGLSLWVTLSLTRTHGLTFTWWGCCELCFWHKATELAHSFLFCSCIYFCLCGPFKCISFHKFSRQLFLSYLRVYWSFQLYESLLQPWYDP